MIEYLVWYLVMSLVIGVIGAHRANRSLYGAMNLLIFLYAVAIFTVAWPYYLYKGEL